jgi:hypothetical protein
MTSGYTLNNFRMLPISSKEELTSAQFSDSDVLDRPEDIRVRGTNIDKAIALGKSKKALTCIILKAGNKLFKIESIVIGLDKNFAFLKNGMKIPLLAIYSVDFL